MIVEESLIGNRFLPYHRSLAEGHLFLTCLTNVKASGAAHFACLLGYA